MVYPRFEVKIAVIEETSLQEFALKCNCSGEESEWNFFFTNGI